MNKKISLLLPLVVLIGLVLLSYVYFVNTRDSRDELAELGFFRFSEPRVLTPVELKNMAGESTNLKQLSGQWQLVNFGYMFCPDICPINLSFISELKTEWDEQNKTSPLSLTHITFDPERDTPDKLKPYLNYISPDLKGLTGEIDNIRKVAQQLNMVYIKEKPDEYGNYFITHGDSIALLNPSGDYVGLFKGPYDQDKVVQALELIIR